MAGYQEVQDYRHSNEDFTEDEDEVDEGDLTEDESAEEDCAPYQVRHYHHYYYAPVVMRATHLWQKTTAPALRQMMVLRMRMRSKKAKEAKPKPTMCLHGEQSIAVTNNKKNKMIKTERKTRKEKTRIMAGRKEQTRRRRTKH